MKTNKKYLTKNLIIGAAVAASLIAEASFIQNESTAQISNEVVLAKQIRGDIISSDNVLLATSKDSNKSRVYAKNDSLSNVLGYVNLEKNAGLRGVEKNYQNKLISGASLTLNISSQLQQSIEKLADNAKTRSGADEIIISIMESKTGKILTLATSNRFDANDPKPTVYKNINNNAIEYLFEPGATMKPIIVAIALDKAKVKLSDEFPACNEGKKDKNGLFPGGIIRINQWNIVDSHQFAKNTINLEDIINVSAIGAVQVANKLSGQELHDGLQQFGLNQKTNIDLSDEAVAFLPTSEMFSKDEKNELYNIYKSTISYGQGINATFMQLLTAYNIFNNDGKIVAPSIVNTPLTNKPHQVISKNTADTVKSMLVKYISFASKEYIFPEGFEIGGKLAISAIATSEGYQDRYNGSFFGFINGKNNKYTIGVMIKDIAPTKDKILLNYSAMSIFEEISNVIKNQNNN